ncbi:LSU ribosomal protein L18p (L5e) [Fimbriiglobus ruber]|uniref:Large ribosomal subunit protein uL18 n=1 Tax=Fimbriiglobus ruber TaxID=1908690 RepID=A0A225D4G5_9BACT|nr:LSU ribosomal protein L18p (L5e) [Fimbriiglobus ruber]
MDAQKLKHRRAERRKHRVRKTIRGTADHPRLSVHRSNHHIYAQLIDDDAQVTLAAASSNDKDTDLKHGGNIAGAAAIGKKLAEQAKAKGIKSAAFDRGAYRFHGRVKALARAATEGGLVCTGLEDVPKKKASSDAAPAPKAAKAPKVKGEGKKPEKAKA